MPQELFFGGGFLFFIYLFFFGLSFYIFIFLILFSFVIFFFFFHPFQENKNAPTKNANSALIQNLL